MQSKAVREALIYLRSAIAIFVILALCLSVRMSWGEILTPIPLTVLSLCAVAASTIDLVYRVRKGHVGKDAGDFSQREIDQQNLFKRR
jgi:hypothetical protein|tara:strand:- start:9777 stop:10040 length:264 start_codon:yes stop_codon:yes gene_type:complete